MSSKDLAEKKPSTGFPHIVQQEQSTVSIKEVAGILADIGDSVITKHAEKIRHNTDEEMIWQESPSLTLMIFPLLKYAVITIVVIVLLQFVGKDGRKNTNGIESVLEVSSQNQPTVARNAKTKKTKTDQSISQSSSKQSADRENTITIIQWGVAGLALLRLLVLFLRLKTAKYWASSQRLIVESGILKSVNCPYELHLLGKSVISKPLSLRFFGVSNLTIGSDPAIVLLGLRNAQYVRDLLRTGGQLEAQRIDKIRWRG